MCVCMYVYTCVCVCSTQPLSSACASTYQPLCVVCMYTIVGVLLYYVLLYVCILLSVYVLLLRMDVYIIANVCVCVGHCVRTTLCVCMCMGSTAVPVCIHVLLCVYLLLYVCVCVLHAVMCACMYTMYVCSTQRACASSLPSCLLSVCVGVSVLTYCLHVVSIVAVMGSPCRTCIVCGIVYVSTVSLGRMYYSRCVLLLMIVCTKK